MIKILTGCLTFYKIGLNNIDIKSSDSYCEDSVNFINTYGSINSIEIQNSFSDGLDIDSSV